MALLTLTNAELAYGDLPLLDRASFALEERERIGLIGRNGTGKSSLLGALAGQITLDDGELRKKDGLRIVLVPQEPAFPINPPAAAHKLEEFFHRLGVDPQLDPAKASGGERKRAALAAALAQEPDVLLLDEPTNPGQLAVEAVVHAKFDKFWAQEEAWIRKGIEARRTRNEGRVRRLERLRDERSARRERSGNVKLAIGEGQRSGKLVCELSKINKSYGGRTLVKDLDLIVSRGDRLGFIGPNGAGKTTLLKLILGTLTPDSGNVRLGANLQPAYFDQLRAALDLEATVADTISPGSEWVELASGRKHIMSYLGDFLFPPRRAHSKVSMLSGGERNRLLLARLFARPANILVLDEPTNDLDIESLELLEAAPLPPP